MLLRSSAPVLALAVSLALPGALQAQGRDVYKLPMPQVAAGAQMGRAQPGVAASSPIGYGPSAGDVFVGAGYQARTGTFGDQDGAVSVGGGFFNPNETVGLEVVLTSLSTVRSGFGSRMVASAKVHKTINNFGIGLGMEGVKINGDEFDTDPSFFLAATTVAPIREAATFNQAVLNIGLGNGRFQTAENFASGESGIGIFASAALRVNSFSSAILDYTGAQLNMALSFVPFAGLPFVITPSLNDVTGAIGSAARPAIGAGMSWKY
jgi:hypothetical protein